MYRQTRRNLRKIFFRKTGKTPKTDSQKCIDKKFSKKIKSFLRTKKTPRSGCFLLDTKFLLSDSPSFEGITCLGWFVVRYIDSAVVYTALSR